MKIFLPFLSPSINKCYYTDKKSFTRHKSKHYRDFLTQCGSYVEKTEKPLHNSLKVELNFIVGDRRRRDIDNMIKPCLDMLCFFNIIEDDSIIEVLHVEKYYRKNEPETRIEINEIPKVPEL